MLIDYPLRAFVASYFGSERETETHRETERVVVHS